MLISRCDDKRNGVGMKRAVKSRRVEEVHAREPSSRSNDSWVDTRLAVFLVTYCSKSNPRLSAFERVRRRSRNEGTSVASYHCTFQPGLGVPTSPLALTSSSPSVTSRIVVEGRKLALDNLSLELFPAVFTLCVTLGDIAFLKQHHPS